MKVVEEVEEEVEDEDEMVEDEVEEEQVAKSCQYTSGAEWTAAITHAPS